MSTRNIFSLNNEEDIARYSYCGDALKIMDRCIKSEKPPEKFPEPCNHCWKVLVFDADEVTSSYIRRKFRQFYSKMVPMMTEEDKEADGRYLIVIYTESIKDRDRVRKALEKDKKIKAKIGFRFACKKFQEHFPEMFISAGKPNPRFL